MKLAMKDSQGYTRAEQERMLVKAVDEYNKDAATANRQHHNENEPFKVLLPYRPVEFTIPNTIAGIEKLSRKEKMELISAYHPPGYPADLERSLTIRVWDSLKLTSHGVITL